MFTRNTNYLKLAGRGEQRTQSYVTNNLDGLSSLSNVLSPSQRSSCAMMDIEMTSPVGPLITTGFDETRGFGFSGYAAEVDLCKLLQSMSLSKTKHKDPEAEATTPCAPCASQSANEHDVDTEDLAYLSDGSESSNSKCSSCDPHPTAPSTSSPAIPASPLPACHFLQSILASLAPESRVLSPFPYPYPASASAFQTTNGAYLDTILTHRSLLAAFPPGHRGCAVALQEIARAVELRAWQADRDSDAEAVAALRQEAYLTGQYNA
ncbi:hypothetical protein ID866_6660 [Astraeus odoratus]|nr:hypothetical protein ID866_6660 [Astraeus odoratus]